MEMTRRRGNEILIIRWKEALSLLVLQTFILWNFFKIKYSSGVKDQAMKNANVIIYMLLEIKLLLELLN